MKIFIDTAKLNEIQEAASWGIVDGVTTNPSLIKKAIDALERKGSMEQYIGDICRAVNGPISLEVKGQKSATMIQEAEQLYERFNGINNNVVIKIPVNTAMNKGDANYEGVKAIKILEEKGIPTNATLVMSPNQAWLAAKAGATYVSPFLGRIDDHIRSGMGLERGKDFAKAAYYDDILLEMIQDEKRKMIMTKEKDTPLGKIYIDERLPRFSGVRSGVDAVRIMRWIFDNYQFNTAIIAASIRNARQVMEVAMIGVEIATIPFTVITEMISHYKTREGMENFTKDLIPEYEALFK
jgi:transaldolase